MPNGIQRTDNSQVQRQPPAAPEVGAGQQAGGEVGLARRIWNGIKAVLLACFTRLARPDPNMHQLVLQDGPQRAGMAAPPDKVFKAVRQVDGIQAPNAMTIDRRKLHEVSQYLTLPFRDPAGWQSIGNGGDYSANLAPEQKASLANVCIGLTKAVVEQQKCTLADQEELEAARNGWQEDIEEGAFDPERSIAQLNRLILPRTVFEGTAEKPQPDIDRTTGALNYAATGLRGRVSINPATRELVVGFQGAGNTRDSIECLKLASGGIPDRFRHADRIVGELKQHLDWVNSQLPPGETPFALRVCGHSLGGAIASYVGARHELPFTTINGLALGSGALANISEEKKARAQELGERYVVQGDWVADGVGGADHLRNRFLNAFGGTRHLGQGYMIPASGEHRDVNRHIHFETFMGAMMNRLLPAAAGRLANQPPLSENRLPEAMTRARVRDLGEADGQSQDDIGIDDDDIPAAMKNARIRESVQRANDIGLRGALADISHFSLDER